LAALCFENEARRIKGFLRISSVSLAAYGVLFFIVPSAETLFVSRENTHLTYQRCMKEFSNSAYVEKAKERIESLKAHKAVVVVDYPKAVEKSLDGGRWSWDTVFKEVGGKSGYKVSDCGYILDPRGGRWVSNGSNAICRSDIKVPAGGSGKDSYWCGDPSHDLCNGYAIFTWTGEDDAGNKIATEVRVHIKHKGCPGPTKSK
jgi:hypothetical protein